MSYITPQGRVNLASYAYKGCDLSLLYKYALSPWAQYLVDHWTPRYVAPNTITLIGLFFQVAAYLVLFSESDNFTGPVSRCAAGFAAFALFVYSTLDNMDGKQSRRIGASSPLGLLFDHGCDAINTGMIGTLIFAMVTGAGPATWQMYGIWAFASTAFFMNTWEEFHIREFILPIVNGPSEGLVMMIALLATTAVFSSDIWQQEPTFGRAFLPVVKPVIDVFRSWSEVPPTDPYTNKDMVVASTAFFLGGTGLLNSINVVQHFRKHMEKESVLVQSALAIGRTLPMWLLHAVCLMWLREPASLDAVGRHPHIFYLTGGAIFADFTSKLMVSHVADQKYRPDYRGMLVFSVGPIAQFAMSRGWLAASSLGPFADANVCLYVAFVTASTLLGTFLYFSITDIARTLDIDVFDPAKQVQRTEAAKRKAEASAQ